MKPSSGRMWSIISARANASGPRPWRTGKQSTSRSDTAMLRARRRRNQGSDQGKNAYEMPPQRDQIGAGIYRAPRKPTPAATHCKRPIGHRLAGGLRVAPLPLCRSMLLRHVRGGRAMRPRLGSATADSAAHATADPSRWTHGEGVSCSVCGRITPTRNAIGLSSLVGGRVGRWRWRAKPVAFQPPPSCVPRLASAQGEEEIAASDSLHVRLALQPK